MSVKVLCELIVTDVPPDTEQDGDAETPEVQETPGPETVQEVPSPGTFEALQESVVFCPARTRSGLAVIDRLAVPAMQ